MLNKLIKLVPPLLFTIVLTVGSAYASNNKTAAVLAQQTPAENTEQYKVTVTKDTNIDDIHVEILPNESGEYWIPKGYDIRVTGDYKDGYKSAIANSTYNINEAKEIALSSTPTGEPTIEQRLTALEEEVANLDNLRMTLDYANAEDISISTQVGEYNFTPTKFGILNINAYGQRDITRMTIYQNSGRYEYIFSTWWTDHWIILNGGSKVYIQNSEPFVEIDAKYIPIKLTNSK